MTTTVPEPVASVERDQGEPSRAGDGRIWVLSLAVAVIAHAACAAALLAPFKDAPDSVAAAPPILVELAPIITAPSDRPVEMAPGPRQDEAQARAEIPPTAEPPNTPAPPVVAAIAAEDPVPAPAENTVETRPAPEKIVPVESPPKPEQKPSPRAQSASRASAPSTAERHAARESAAAPGASARDDNALPSWKSQLVARLERSKHYPSEAQSRGDQGVALLAFEVDRQGGVHRARIARSSGSDALDRETLALLQRAQPLPAPPSDMRGTQIAITVPIRYSMR